MNKTLTAILACFALSVSAAGVRSQITYIPGTGCKNAANTPIVGSTKIGQTITVAHDQLPCNSPQTYAFVLLSFSCGTVPNLPFGCISSSNPCTALIPADASFFKPITASITLTIPNDPKIIGAKFCVQGGCFTSFLGFCVSPLNVVGQITIQ
ncbi:MAG: hypothetical protein H6832_12560 [Planctomycetes bacterium]|nr:hypothetical protein [Planctomycetota bacterium]MCB9891669.1 hypothetical protein [Planctomycetota bacterium]MCB9919225.1 hypothetical protein [Planctomycetota bacterium]